MLVVCIAIVLINKCCLVKLSLLLLHCVLLVFLFTLQFARKKKILQFKTRKVDNNYILFLLYKWKTICGG